LSTSRKRGAHARSPRGYVVASLACAAFAAVYEHFSHGVYSVFMVGRFAWPLVLGAVPALLAGLRGARVPPAARRAWALGVATLTAGSAFQGVLEIYGTTSPLVVAYWVAGPALLVLAVVLALAARPAPGRRPERRGAHLGA